MMEDWEIFELGSGLNLLNGYAFKSKFFTDNVDDIILIKGSNLGKGVVLWGSSKYWSKKDELKFSKYLLQTGDVLLAMDRPWVSGGLKYASIKKNDPKSFLVQRIACLRSNEKMDQNFLKFVIASHNFSAYIKSLQGGVGVPHISPSQIKNYKFNLPPLKTQRKIASILTAYDDLLENNLKRIKLLEEQAQQTYEEWFVRFKFPGYENVEIDEESGLPAGWEKVKASERIKLVSGYAFKGKEFTDIPNDDIAVRMGNFKVGGGLKFDKSKYLIDSSEVREKFHLKHNDLVMVLSDVTREGLLIGNVGFVPIDGRNYYLNQRVSKVVTEDDFKMYAYAAFNSASFKHNCKSKANSVTVLNLKNDDVYSFKMVIPSKEIIGLWNKIYGSSIKMTQNLERQNQYLKEARDILLPRLMSGVIEVAGLEVSEQLGMVAEEKSEYKKA
ncbi:restriction endonuclease subunit S [Zobellia nedashkovskayae]|uniref:restriction endonuclease subunit S n=1 Tax=Zobellia nedashkovskayae TaxID=2779510 RepID=UPI00188DB854|nr:restriction endonuclease subunit S [Zobellia nedashkovskayae]